MLHAAQGTGTGVYIIIINIFIITNQGLGEDGQKCRCCVSSLRRSDNK
jgi:hypothetical protein